VPNTALSLAATRPPFYVFVANVFDEDGDVNPKPLEAAVPAVPTVPAVSTVSPLRSVAAVAIVSVVTVRSRL
jgi:hypothetical protein